MSDDQDPLLRLLAVAARRIADELNDELIRAGFVDHRMAHHSVFAHLPAEGGRLTDLAERAGISKQAMSELVVDLEHLGYVRRVPDPTDRRARIIEYTDRGLACTRAAAAAFNRIESDLVEDMGARRVAALRRALADIAR